MGTFQWGKSNTQANVLNLDCADVNLRHISTQDLRKLQTQMQYTW